MIKDVNIIVSDGQMSTGDGDGIHVKIGVSPIAYTEPIAIKGDLTAKRIQERLGLSPLADACMDSVANGCGLIYCIPVAATTEGTVSTVTKTAADETSGGTMTITGKPNNRYTISTKITKSGGFNTAVLKYSFDGVTYSDEVTMPTDGSLVILPTGLTLKFTEGAGETKFVAGDLFSATTTAPQASNEAILAALAHVREVSKTIEFVHIVGESTNALWSALAVEAEKFFSTYYKPVFFLLEAAAPTAEQTTRQYIDALVESRKAINSYFIQVCTARGLYTRMDGTTQSINLAGVISGLYARAKVAQSISETASFAIPADKLIRLEPQGIMDDLDLLDEAQFLTMRSYEGLSGWYVTKPHVLCSEGSDYRYAEHVRVLNKAARLVRREALLQLHKSIDISKLDEELAAIGAFIAAPLMGMVEAEEISAGEITIPTGQNILADEHLTVILRFVPRGYVRWITIDLGMKNPNV